MKPFLLVFILLLVLTLLTHAKERRPRHQLTLRQSKQLKRQQQKRQQKRQQQRQQQQQQQQQNDPSPPPPSLPHPDKNAKSVLPEHQELLHVPGHFAKLLQLERKPQAKKGNSKNFEKLDNNRYEPSGNNKRLDHYSGQDKQSSFSAPHDPHLPLFENEQHQKLTPKELVRSYLSNDQYAQLLNFDLTTQRSDEVDKSNAEIGVDGEKNKHDDHGNDVESSKKTGIHEDYYHLDHYDNGDDDDFDNNDNDIDLSDDRRNGGWGSAAQSPNNNSFETLFGKHYGTFDNGPLFHGGTDVGDGDGDISTSGYITFLDMGNPVQVFDCPEKCRCKETVVDCSAQAFTSVPKNINPMTTILDLSINNLQKLPEDSFAHLTHLEDLRIVGNNITRLPRKLFKHNTLLRLLNFQGNEFVKVPPRAFQNLQYLLELHLDANVIRTIPKNAFRGLFRLQQLRLDANELDHIPTEALKELTGLQAVTFASNNITRIPAKAFQNNTRLIHLGLSNNDIKTVEDNAFLGLSRLKYLQLERNRIEKMPTAFSHLTDLEELFLEKNSISHLPDMSFQFKDKLAVLGLRNNPIKTMGERVFSHLPSLTELILSEVHDLIQFPDLTGTTSLVKLQLDRASIKSLPKDFCRHLPNLTSFDIHSNKIGTIPNMSLCVHLSNLNMANNELTSLDGQLFKGLSNLHDLTLSNNFIHTIPANAFIGLSSLEYLNMAENQISFIHDEAFVPLKSLTDLNLGDNHIGHLPTAGLSKLLKLKVFHNKELREFPPKEAFPHTNHFVLAYAYHCCDFIHSRQEQSTQVLLRENIVWMGGFRAPDTSHSNRTFAWPLLTRNINKNDQNMTVDKNHDVIMQLLNEENNFDNDNYYSDNYNYDSGNLLPMLHENGSAIGEDGGGYEDGDYGQDVLLPQASISCRPKPGPFMPCDDLFGWWSLRCGVWIVFLLALLGNFVVFFVSVTSRSKMDVPRFLICNLALADFFMGIYLGILAIVDASTLGQFKKYAIQWQMSPGCLVAGFLGVFSSELSVFTLTVITLERFYAITHAMQLNKRLSLKHSSVIMLGGWIFCFGVATMPLFGISDYRKFAICLPFEIEDIFSKGYVCSIMTFNGIAFFIILSCYLIMYISIRDSQAWNSNETRVAKRMALLVFTDFMCWAPIAFLSLAAAFGKHLIHLNEAKVLTIFILPLNSCANPFLYAFFTKQFKKDCVLFCRRLEDSSIARHFSQVSQRHVSVSWKCQRRQSGLNSLMGDGKSQISQNNSNGSNSYGLVNNYNSEVSSRTNKDANAKDTCTNDVKATFKSAPKSTRKSNVKSGGSEYKYSPCPVENVDRTGRRSDENLNANSNELIRSRSRMDDAQVTLHADPCVQHVMSSNGDERTLQSKAGDNNNNQKRLDAKQYHSNNSSTISNNKISNENVRYSRRPPSASYSPVWCVDEELGIISDEESSVWKKMATDYGDNGNDNKNDVNTTCKNQPISPVRTKLGSIGSYYSVEQPKLSPQHINNTTQNQRPKSFTENVVNSSDKSGDLRKTMQKQNQQIHIHSNTTSSKHKRRKNLQCCSANSSPIDHSGYEFVGEQRRKHGNKKGGNHCRKSKNIQYVTTMPEEMQVTSTSQTVVESQKLEDVLECCALVSDLTRNVEKLTIQTCSQDSRVKVNDSHSLCKTETDTSLVRVKSQHSQNTDGKDNIKSSDYSCEKHQPNGSLISSKHPDETLVSKDELTRKPPVSSNTISNTTGFPVLTREFLHHHTAVDKSVHLRYFQQSIAGHDFVCKSNSLVELTQSQLKDARVQSIPVPYKRGSLTPADDVYDTILAGKEDELFVRSYCHHQRQQRSHYCNFRQYSVGEASDDCSYCFSTDVYAVEQTSDSLEDDYNNPHVTADLIEGLSNFRNASSDWKRAKRNEIDGLLADSDTDDFEGKHDSISSAKNSADQESGFHSQN